MQTVALIVHTLTSYVSILELNEVRLIGLHHTAVLGCS